MEQEPTAQAVYISELLTGSLVTPFDAQELRTSALRVLGGYDALRRAWFLAACRNAALIPDGHCDRHEWAMAAAEMTDR